MFLLLYTPYRYVHTSMCSLLVIILHHLKKTKYHWSLVRYHKWEILVYGECENIKQAIATTTTTTTTTERDSAINYLVPTTVMFGHRRCPMIISTTCVCVFFTWSEVRVQISNINNNNDKITNFWLLVNETMKKCSQETENTKKKKGGQRCMLYTY